MSIITRIDGIPLFSTSREALEWSAANGLYGYHIHTHEARVGYMGGINHKNAVSPSKKTDRFETSDIIYYISNQTLGITPKSTPPRQQNIVQQPVTRVRQITDVDMQTTVVTPIVEQPETQIPPPPSSQQMRSSASSSQATYSSGGSGGGGY